jgi:transcription elongation factor Elf1
MKGYGELPLLLLFREINGRLSAQPVQVEWEPGDDRGPTKLLDPEDRYLMLSVTGTILLRHENGKIRMRQLRAKVDEDGSVTCPICDLTPKIAVKRENKSTIYYCRYCDIILPGDYDEPEEESEENESRGGPDDPSPIPPF